MSWLNTIAGVQSAEDVMNPIKQNANGTWTVPETFTAGNKWSKGEINKDWASQFGGTYSAAKPTYSAITNPFNPNYASGQGQALNPGSNLGSWTFNQDPTQYISSGQGANFIPGQGSSKLKSAMKDIAPIAGIAALPFAAAGLAGMAGGQGFMGGISGMSGMGGAGAGTMPMMGMAGTGAGMGGTAAGGAAGAGGLLSGSIPSMAGSATMGGSGIGAMGGTGFGAAGMTPMAAGGAASAAGGGLSGLWGQAKNAAGSLFGGGGGGGLDIGKGLLGIGQGALQYMQGKDLKDIAAQSADRADPLKAAERRPYQDLLSQYYFGGQDITQQPMMKANLDFARDESNAKLARMGFSGSGAQATAAGDYTNKVFQANAMPYLNTLQGIAGFGMGPGNAGSLYQGGMSDATSAPSRALNSVVGGFTSPSPDKSPWYNDANYSQNQMTQIPGGGTYRKMA